MHKPAKKPRIGKTVPRKTRDDRIARFVAEFLVDMNATQAAIRAGYQAKGANVTACHLMQRPDVAAAVAKAQAARVERTEITADRVLRELALIAYSDMRKFSTWGSRGVRLNDSAGLSDDDARCVAEVSESVTKDGGTIRFKLHDKVKALELLGKHLGMFTEQTDNLNFDLSTATDAQLEHLANGGSVRTMPRG